VIVCDGFTGNIAIKISESLAEMIGANLKKIFMTNWASKLGYFFLKPHLAEFKKKVDHSETGGAPLLGINGVCIIAHGSSSPKAIKNAIKRAKELIEKKINQHIQDDIELNLGERKGGLWHSIKHIAFGDEEKDNGNASPEADKPAENKKESSDSDS